MQPDTTISAFEDARKINLLRPEINRLQNYIYEYRRSHGIKPGEPLFGFEVNDERE